MGVSIAWALATSKLQELITLRAAPWEPVICGGLFSCFSGNGNNKETAAANGAILTEVIFSNQHSWQQLFNFVNTIEIERCLPSWMQMKMRHFHLWHLYTEVLQPWCLLFFSQISTFSVPNLQVKHHPRMVGLPMFTYIYHKGTYTVHGCPGLWCKKSFVTWNFQRY